MTHDERVKAQMQKALSLAKDCLTSAKMATPPMPRPVGEAYPDKLLIVIIAAAIYNDVQM
jgi:hypothetical protein